MSTLINDVKFAFRQLRKSPGFTCATVLILALGIGGVTAMFSTLYTVMIRPLPYEKPERLVLGRATFNGDVNPMVSVQDYFDYRERSRSFSSLEAYFDGAREITVTTDQGTQREQMLAVSPGLLSTLGVNMVLGRSFTAAEGQAAAQSEIIVSYDYWQSRLGGRADAIGTSLVVNGTSRDLVGVAPRDFHFIYDVDVWLPMPPKSQNNEPRRYHNWIVLGRLKDGVSLAEAQSEVDVISAQLEQTYPDTNATKALLLTPVQSAFAEQYRSCFSMLCGGAGAILLIACANAAGLLLARGAGRHGELAVRAAMGASRWRLVRLLITEALILAGGAGAAGTILAVLLQNVLLHLMPIEILLLGKVGLSSPMLLFVLVVTAITGLAFGILPALRARRVNVAQDLRSSGRGTLQHGTRLRGGLVAGQVALSVILLVIAGLLMRSLTWLLEADPGFNTQNLMTVEVPLPQQGYPDERRLSFFASLLSQLRAIPGVQSAAAISQLPLRNPFNNVDIYAATDAPTKVTESPSGYQRVVLPGYFETLGIPLLAGRDIRASDTAASGRVVVISRLLAETLFPDRDPLGQQVIIDRDSNVLWEVVGVVGDVKASSLYEQTIWRGTFYRAYGQQTPSTMCLAVRTAGDPHAVVAPFRVLLRKMDPQIPLSGPRTMTEIMSNSTVSYKAIAVCLTTFSLLALILAAIGIYGLLAYVVAQRRCDIGIRMALGAEPSAILGMVLRSGTRLVGIGLGLGLLGAFALARIVRHQLYGVKPADALTFAGVIVVLGVVAGVACYIPARRAAKVDPMEALRYE